MAKVTKIKANDSPRKKEDEAPTITRKKVVIKDKKSAKEKKRAERKANKLIDRKSEKKPFILIRPFVYFGRYLRDSWRELRQVRWPNRKATWKMVLAVIIYTALFVLIISLLDIFFTWLFNLILGKG